MLKRRTIQFTKRRWFHKSPFAISKEPTIKDLLPTFTGYLSVNRFYHTQKTKVGHLLITSNGIGEIVKITKPTDTIYLNKYRYSIKLMDNTVMHFNENEVKHLVVNPIDFYDNKVSIPLSFLDYLYANPYGITLGVYAFRLTTHGYAKMTDNTMKLLKINKILIKIPGGKRFLKIIKDNDFIIIKKDSYVGKS